MRTLGVDLASQPAKTGVCVVEWSDVAAGVVEISVGADDDRILELVSEVDGVGIDAPFGWPQDFVEQLTEDPPYTARVPERRDALRYRLRSVPGSPISRPPELRGPVQRSRSHERRAGGPSTRSVRWSARSPACEIR